MNTCPHWNTGLMNTSAAQRQNLSAWKRRFKCSIKALFLKKMIAVLAPYWSADGLSLPRRSQSQKQQSSEQRPGLLHGFHGDGVGGHRGEHLVPQVWPQRENRRDGKSSNPESANPQPPTSRRENCSSGAKNWKRVELDRTSQSGRWMFTDNLFLKSG